MMLCKVRFNPGEVRLNIEELGKIRTGILLNVMSFSSFLMFG